MFLESISSKYACSSNAGSDIQDNWGSNPAEDVVSEHEDQVGCARDRAASRADNLALCMQRVQLQQLVTFVHVPTIVESCGVHESTHFLNLF